VTFAQLVLAAAITHCYYPAVRMRIRDSIALRTPATGTVTGGGMLWFRTQVTTQRLMCSLRDLPWLFSSPRAPADSRRVKFERSTYVDVRTVHSVVNPSGIGALPHVGKLRDVGFATQFASGATTSFIIRDAGGGSDAKLEEGSIALFAALGRPNPNPRTGTGLPTTRSST
jgi:hypothetical protein